MASWPFYLKLNWVRWWWWVGDLLLCILGRALLSGLLTLQPETTAASMSPTLDAAASLSAAISLLEASLRSSSDDDD